MPEWLRDALRESPAPGIAICIGVPLAVIVLGIAGVVPAAAVLAMVGALVGVLLGIRHNRTR